MLNVLSGIAGYFSTSEVKVLLVLIGLDVLSGIAAAIATKDFQPKKLAEFLLSNVFPYVLIYVGLKAAVFLALPEWSAALAVVYAAIVATLLSSINENLKSFDVQVPNPLRR